MLQAEVCLELPQTSMMELYGQKIDGLKPSMTVVKKLIIDVWQWRKSFSDGNLLFISFSRIDHTVEMEKVAKSREESKILWFLFDKYCRAKSTSQGRNTRNYPF